MTRFEGFRYVGTGNQNIFYGLVFLVPKTARSFTLHFGKARKDFSAEESELNRAEVAKFTIEEWKSKRPEDTDIARERLLGPTRHPEGKIVETLQSPFLDEMLLVVHYLVTPIKPNHPSGFRLSTADIGLKPVAAASAAAPTAQVPYLAPIGYFESEEYRDGHTTHECKRDQLGEFPPFRMVLVFLYRWDRRQPQFRFMVPPGGRVGNLSTATARFETHYLLEDAKAIGTISIFTRPN